MRTVDERAGTTPLAGPSPRARAWASPDLIADILTRQATRSTEYLRFSGLIQEISAYSINLGYSWENRAAPAAEEEKGRGYRGMATEPRPAAIRAGFSRQRY
ncbi:hypothetical protein BQ8482_111624 [Mesorhizobium delmotii]|uniref:Uncharacterized protein n=1 Tax=Mesorhizobium delmotii TaxID=1631247 RepID=A0A2P9AF17_9HYPH|nr:hypothetical protein BQ8482_111624 [Mesorhizobium delmotii]